MYTRSVVGVTRRFGMFKHVRMRTRHVRPQLLEMSSKGSHRTQAKLYQEGVGYTKRRALICRGCLGSGIRDRQIADMSRFV
jgi:hypothetical protein